MVSGSAVTLVGGLAVTRNGRSRPAAHRTDAQRASSTNSGGGPSDVAATTSRRRSLATGASSGSRATTQPVTRRPCNGTRTRVPTCTSIPSGTA